MVALPRLCGSILLVLVVGCVGLWADESVPRFGIFETTLAGPDDLKDPYERARVTVVFTGPENSGPIRFELEAFWDGEGNWKVRMSPTHEGRWSWKSRSGVEKLNGQTGTFLCVASNSAGFLRTDPLGNPHLVLRAGRPVYLLGAGGNVLSDFSLKDGSFQKYIDTRLAQGFNFLYYSPVLTEKANEGGKPFIDRNSLKPNPDYFRSADQRMYYCRLKGMVPVIGIDSPEKLNRRGLERLWRHVVARYAAFDVVWVITGRPDDETGDRLRIVRILGGLTRKLDPYHHPVMAQLSGSEIDAIKEPWLDGVLHVGTDWKELKRVRGFGKPVINIGSCVEDLTDKVASATDISARRNTLRQRAWNIAMRGGYPVYQTIGLDAKRPETFNSVGAGQVGILGQMFRQIDWAVMIPTDQLLLQGQALVRARLGSDYMAYLDVGQKTVSLDVSAIREGIWVQWFDPRRGKVTHRLNIPRRDVLTVNTPNATNDWVLHVFEARPARAR